MSDKEESNVEPDGDDDAEGNNRVVGVGSDTARSADSPETTPVDGVAAPGSATEASKTAASDNTGAAHDPQTGADSRQASASIPRWVLSLGLVAGLVAIAFALYSVFFRPGDSGSDAAKDQSGEELAPGAGEAADFDEREPANPGGAQDQSGSSGAIALGVGDWTEAGFVGAIVARVLGELGYEIRGPNAMGPNEAYNALASGQLDIWTDAWTPAHQPYLAVDTEDGSTVGDQITTIATTTPSGAVMGIFVNTDWANANGVETVEDVLAQPDAGPLFDLTGDQIPDFYGCNPEWPCAETINEVIRERGWRVSQFAGDYDASVRNAAARVDNGEPALVFTWLPSAYGDLLGVADGRFSLLGVADARDSSATAATPCLADPCVPGFAVDDLGIVASKGFVAEHPDIVSVLENVAVPQGDISAALGAVAAGATLDTQAQAWIETHRGEVDAWLAAGA